MMKHRWSIAAMWLLALAPLALVALFYPRLPGQVPVHWGLDGAVDRYGSRNELWGMAAMGPLFALLFQFLPRLDPRRRSYEKFQRYYEAFALVMEGFLTAVTGLILAEILRPGSVSMGRVIGALVGLLFLFVGNMLGKVKPNFFMGIRTPWTLSDPDVWNRTHRLGGALFFLTGLAVLIAALLLPEAVTFWVLMAGVAAAALVPAVMSVLWYRKRKAP